MCVHVHRHRIRRVIGFYAPPQLKTNTVVHLAAGGGRVRAEPGAAFVILTFRLH